MASFLVVSAGLSTLLSMASLTPRISAYTLSLMKIMKIRRVGNSNVVSIPRDLEAHGFTPGEFVVLDETATGELRMVLAGDARDRIREVGRSVIEDNRDALAILQEHDRSGHSAAAAARTARAS